MKFDLGLMNPLYLLAAINTRRTGRLKRLWISRFGRLERKTHDDGSWVEVVWWRGRPYMLDWGESASPPHPAA